MATIEAKFLPGLMALPTLGIAAVLYLGGRDVIAGDLTIGEIIDRYRGSEYSTAYLPKVEITVWVTDEQSAALGEVVPKVARTGRIGDGKVFVVPVAWDEPLEF